MRSGMMGTGMRGGMWTGMRDGMRGGMRGWPGLRALVLAVVLCAPRSGGTELTFELPDSDKQCFHQELERGLKFTLDYQVLPCPQRYPCFCPLPPARTPHPCPCPYPPPAPCPYLCPPTPAPAMPRRAPGRTTAAPPPCAPHLPPVLYQETFPALTPCPPQSHYWDVPTAATPDPAIRAVPLSGRST